MATGPIRIVSPEGPIEGTFHLPGSKSISNRLLIMQALAGSENLAVEGLSSAEDTRMLMQCLQQAGKEYYCGEGGTTFRFLMAFCCTQPGIKTLDAAGGFYGRPITGLIDALRQCGVSIKYAGQEGIPPIVIESMANMDYPLRVSLPGNITSQYVSSLMLIAPYFKGGGVIQCSTPMVSVPYIDMTRSLMEEAGVRCSFQGNTISIDQGEYRGSFSVEADWSAASYAYSLCALRPGSEIFMPSLSLSSLQGDKVCAEIGKFFGVHTQIHNGGISIASTGLASPEFHYVFESCPDLAQTFILAAFGLGIRVDARGLVTLRRKETDRLWALANAISKLGGNTSLGKDFFFASGQPSAEVIPLPVYNDHRMAMSLAPLSLVTGTLLLSEGEVVEKSFPEFWKQLEQLGFGIIAE